MDGVVDDGAREVAGERHPLPSWIVAWPVVADT